MDTATRNSLIESFQRLGFTRLEAEIAADGPTSTATPTTERGEIFEPVRGRGGYREF
jgi:hypothetical protein